MKQVSDKIIDDIMKLKFGKIIDIPGHTAFVSNKTLGKVFNMSEHKIASLLRVRYAKNRYNNLSFLQKLRPLIKSDIPYQNFKGRQRFGLKFLKSHEIKWIVNAETLKIQTGMSLKDRAQHFMK